MRKLILLSLFLLCAVPAAGAPVFKFYAGGNAVWFDGPNGLPSDFELGGTTGASLAPHLSLVGGLFFGLDNSYARGTAGIRVTATDVNDPNFSVGLGLQYQASSEPRIRTEEWMPEVSLGWKPWPDTTPRLILGGQGAYGIESGQAQALIAVRWELGGL